MRLNENDLLVAIVHFGLPSPLGARTSNVRTVIGLVFY